MIKLFDIEFNQTEDIMIEGTAKGDLLISLTGDGRFAGDRLSGKVVPVGMGTTYTLTDGINIIDAPTLLETYDGAKIFMRISAYLHLGQEQEQKLMEGSGVSPEDYYYKGTAEFDVGDVRYKWLENRVFICEGVIEDWSLLRFSVYEV